MQVQPINNGPNFGKVTVVAVRKNIFKSPEDTKACYNEFQQAFYSVTGEKPANLVNILYGANKKLSDNVILPSRVQSYNILPDCYITREKDYHLFMVCTGREKNELEDKLNLQNRLSWIKRPNGDENWFFKQARFWILSATYHGGWDGFILKDWKNFSNIIPALLEL